MFLTRRSFGDWSEGGYIFVSKIPDNKFYDQRKLFYGNYIDSQY